jgi:hypothetical protein
MAMLRIRILTSTKDNHLVKVVNRTLKFVFETNIKIQPFFISEYLNLIIFTYVHHIIDLRINVLRFYQIEL